MLHAVIMAGGSGTRFWPESREAFPKQLLCFTGERTLLQSTFDRLERSVDGERIHVVTGERIVDHVAKQLPELAATQILVEPCRRDTAPCIAWAALVVLDKDPDATLVVLPADHVIEPLTAFESALAHAARLVEADPTRIVTFGVRPTYPATSFGYIERGARLPCPADEPATFRAVRFREKPPASIAQEYLAAGTFDWNSGIFVWRAAQVIAELEQRQPEMIAHLRTIVAAAGTTDYAAILSREFAAIRAISIDYAVLEHAENVIVVEAPFRWDDVGSWQALARLHGSDAQGNTIIGRHLGVDSRGCIVRSTSDHLIVTLGLKDCLIVHTADATFVANKHDEEAVREVVKQLRAENAYDVL